MARAVENRAPFCGGAAIAAKEFGGGKHRDAGEGQGEAGHQFAAQGHDPKVTIEILAGEFFKAVLLALIGKDHGNRPFLAPPCVELLEELLAADFVEDEVTRFKHPERARIDSEAEVFLAIAALCSFQDRNRWVVDHRVE